MQVIAEHRKQNKKKDKTEKTNFIIRGIRDYRKNESTLNLTRDFLKEKLHWKGKFAKQGGLGGYVKIGLDP